MKTENPKIGEKSEVQSQIDALELHAFIKKLSIGQKTASLLISLSQDVFEKTKKDFDIKDISSFCEKWKRKNKKNQGIYHLKDLI